MIVYFKININGCDWTSNLLYSLKNNSLSVSINGDKYDICKIKLMLNCINYITSQYDSIDKVNIDVKGCSYEQISNIIYVINEMINYVKNTNTNTNNNIKNETLTKYSYFSCDNLMEKWTDDINNVNKDVSKETSKDTSDINSVRILKRPLAQSASPNLTHSSNAMSNALIKIKNSISCGNLDLFSDNKCNPYDLYSILYNINISELPLIKNDENTRRELYSILYKNNLQLSHDELIIAVNTIIFNKPN